MEWIVVAFVAGMLVGALISAWNAVRAFKKALKGAGESKSAQEPDEGPAGTGRW